MYTDKFEASSTAKLPIKTIVIHAWKNIDGSKKPVFFAFLITAVFLYLFNDIKNSYHGPWMLQIMALMLTWLFSGGLFYMGICRASSLSLKVSMVFRAFNFKISFKLILTYVLVLTLLVAPVAFFHYVVQYFIASYALTPIGQALSWTLFVMSIALALAVLIRLNFAKFMVIAQYADPLSAVMRSYKRTKNNFWRLALLQLIGIGALFIGVLSFGIGLIWAVPFNLIILGLAYKHLVGGQVI